MKWIILFTLFYSEAQAAIWIPHEKEIWGIIRRAEKTPEMLIETRYPGIEKLNIDRRYELIEGQCPVTSSFKISSPPDALNCAVYAHMSKN